MTDLIIEHGSSDLDNTTAAQFLAMVQLLFDNAPAGADAYFEVDFEDNEGFLRTVRIEPVIDEYETTH